MGAVYDIEVKDIRGRQYRLEDYRGKVLLIVNTASKCGFTPQFEGLEKLHQKYQGQGLVVLGFPCNQFLSQDPGTDSQIQEFCSLNYGVSFPMHSKLDVNGPQAHPLFRYLKKEAKGVLGTEAIKWNFTKFLVDRQGKVRHRFPPTATPEQMESAIEDLLKA